jgi:hypothetical protein
MDPCAIQGLSIVVDDGRDSLQNSKGLFCSSPLGACQVSKQHFSATGIQAQMDLPDHMVWHCQEQLTEQPGPAGPTQN